MVESIVVNSNAARPPEKPIGVLAAFTLGYDRIVSQPLLILPPILLDLFLWLGPRLKITALVKDLVDLLRIPPEIDPVFAREFPQAVLELGERFNLVSVLSSIPLGIPSIMSGRIPVFLFGLPGMSYARMPTANPLGPVTNFDLDSPTAILLSYGSLILLGVGLGALYQRWIGVQFADGERKVSLLSIVLRLIAFALIAFTVFGMGVLIFLLISGIAGLILPILGLIVGLIGFGIIFWAGIYLIFTPHAIVQQGLGVFRAMVDSINLVRWNLMGTVGFLIVLAGISWLTGAVWSLPQDNSWYSALAVLGHAFVSATLIAGSYAFYRSRHEWLRAWQEAYQVRKEALQAEGTDEASGSMES